MDIMGLWQRWFEMVLLVKRYIYISNIYIYSIYVKDISRRCTCFFKSVVPLR